MVPVALSPSFSEAFVFAAERYVGKVRGNTRVPAIAHAMAVTALVLDLGGDEDEATAALLHDMVEDGASDGPGRGAAALEEIKERWGDHVAALVEELTDEVESTGASWLDRKTAYLATMADCSPSALRISLADKTDNTRTLLRGLTEEGDALFARHTAGDRETFLWYYESLVAQFQARQDDLGAGAGPMLLELARVVDLLRIRSS
ncbi:MAG: HD domain-containing protein [Solirubrobacteraceae bacterium]|nr:HD domain-containing protein [Solirubrobacteraceae bacterium]